MQFIAVAKEITCDDAKLDILRCKLRIKNISNNLQNKK